MSDFPWLTVLALTPLVGAAVTACFPRTPGTVLPKQVALGFALLTLATVVAVVVQYDAGAGMQFTETHVWIEAFGAHYALGVDGLALTLVGLTALLTPVVILASWHDADERNTNLYFALMLALEGLALGVFMATDVFLFYVLFEATLIPAYFLVGSFGREGRGKAAVKFLLFMLGGGLVMLASVIGLYVVSSDNGAPSYLIADLAALDITGDTGRWLFVGFFIALAIKCPLFPVHTWLPDTTAASTPGTSVLLVCVLDKIGTYGMLRFCLGLFPEAARWATPLVITLALISVIYGALVAVGQDDLLRLIGLTSLSHFGYIVLGIFVMNSQGISGATLFMVNHGLATAALFLVAGYLIKRRGGSALISQQGGLEKVTPRLAGLFLVAGLASLGLPGLSPFVSEFLVMLGAFSYGWWVGAIAVIGIVLAAMYILIAYARTFTGPTRPGFEGITDLGRREVVAIVPLLVALVFLGFYPAPVLDVINPATKSTMTHVGKTDPPADVAGDQRSGSGKEAQK
jgi:NADH-quinone oxidoreductase subunit M